MPARKWRKEGPLHLMLLPSLVLLLMFSYLPMAGIVIAFQKFNPGLGVWRSKWIGWDNFTYLFMLPNFNQVLINTVVIAGMKIIVGILQPLIVSIMLNEVRHKLLKSGIQTIIYLPHFLSWVILAGILIDLLSMKGLVNAF